MRPVLLVALALVACEPDPVPPPRYPAAPPPPRPMSTTVQIPPGAAALGEQWARADAERRRELAFEDWKVDAPARCTTTGDESACAAPPVSTPSEAERVATLCREICRGERRIAVLVAYRDARDVCVAGDGPAACVFESHADELAPRADECAKACAERRKVGREVGALELAFRRCMFAVDSRPETLRMRILDRALYDDTMQKAQARCAREHRCDYVAAQGGECAYGN